VGRIGSPLPRARVLTREWTVTVEPAPPAKGDTVRFPGYGRIPTGLPIVESGAYLDISNSSRNLDFCKHRGY